MIHILRGPAPKSLDAGNGWRGQDVLDELYASFLGKCYLCERTVMPEAFEVDHRVQQAWTEGEALRHDWENLYLACQDCNHRRLKGEQPSLDPCQTDSLTRLHQRWRWEERSSYFSARRADDAPAAATVRELNHLHGRESQKGFNLRHAILHQIYKVVQTERDLLEASSAERRRELEAKLRDLVSQKAPFTALIRSNVTAHTRDLFD